VDKENQLAILQAMLNQISLEDPKFKSLIRQQISNAWKKREQRAIDRETIRRLKIQNKKLLERVAFLKEQLKTIKKDKKQMLNRIKQFVKLNNPLNNPKIRKG
jgi:hypothetical protein